MLCCLGDLVEDIAVHRPSGLARGADTDVEIDRRQGGSAANVAIAAATSGIPVRFIGSVGDDAVGAALGAELERAGVEVCLQRRGRTGTIIVLIEPDGDRTMLRDRGAAADLDRLPPPGLTGVTWLHVPAYSLVEGSVAAVARDALHQARNASIATSLDVSSTSIIEDAGPDAFRLTVGDVAPDVVFCNEAEADLLGVGDHGLGGARLTVVKRGPDPAFAITDSGERVLAPARFLGDVTDTTGAGDAFAAGFIGGRMRGEAITACLEAGHGRAAALIQSRRP
ncbi:MAG TPA: PfkB family carbohydrate kinase [Acidimicrobiia bacterium]|nr:PfkB family carbohydrate kinase [Acidimicrobiia bacterium]